MAKPTSAVAPVEPLAPVPVSVRIVLPLADGHHHHLATFGRGDGSRRRARQDGAHAAAHIAGAEVLAGDRGRGEQARWRRRGRVDVSQSGRSGRTLCRSGNPTLLTNHIIKRSAISYTDFTPLAVLFTESVAISVRADSPLRTGRDLLERLRQDSASVSFSVGSSLGSANHIAMGELARLAGADTKRLKAVVFQGGGEAMTALLGGHVDLIASAANNVVPHIAAGKIRVLGITAPHRLTGPLAAVPTWHEQGADVTTNNWRMVAGAKSLAATQIAYWEDVLRRLAETDEWKADLQRNGFENLFMTHQPALAFLKSQNEELRRALAEIGMAK